MMKELNITDVKLIGEAIELTGESLLGEPPNAMLT
jgi:hypothetical protein